MIGIFRYISITYIISLLFELDQISANEEIKCLSLDPNVTISCSENPCETGYCIGIDTRTANCCTESHCPETGLLSFPKNFHNKYVLKWEQQYDDKTWYRRRQMIGGIEDTLTCLLPKSFELNTVASKFDRKSTPRCKTSSECQDNEFCGTVTNPSFCPDNKVCLDKSAEDGSSLTFCFKMPDVKNKRFLAARKEVGLPVCESDEDCKKELPNEVTSCEGTNIGVRKFVGEEVKTVQKICAKELDQLDGEEQSCLMYVSLAAGISLLIFVLIAVIVEYILYRRLKKKLDEKTPSIVEGDEQKMKVQNDELAQKECAANDQIKSIANLKEKLSSIGEGKKT